MRFIDLTAELAHGMVRHPAPHLPPVEMTPVATHAKDKRLVHRVSFGTHVSTHIDAPSHGIEGGASIDQIAIEVFCGTAALIRFDEATKQNPIDVSQLEASRDVLDRSRRVVLETGWARKQWGSSEYFTQGPFLTREASQYLAGFDLALLGMDFPNVDCDGETRPGIQAPNHGILLGAGLVLLENLLNLEQIEASEFQLIALPLKLIGGDGCPCRAVAQIPD
jgi:kynurenine formamidase